VKRIDPNNITLDMIDVLLEKCPQMKNIPFLEFHDALKSALAIAPEVEDPVVNRAAELIQYRNIVSYNESYFGEPIGELKKIICDIERLYGKPKR
jgi:hypothetical protein